MMRPESVSEEFALASILGEPLPLLIIDTCILGDIFRGILAGRAEKSILVLDWLCSCRRERECCLVVPKQVVNEFYAPGQFVNAEVNALKAPAGRWNAALAAYMAYNRFPRIAGLAASMQIDIDSVEKVYSGILNEIAEVFEDSIIVESSHDAQTWARNRQMSSMKPAKRGKDSFGDCEICGSAISLISKVRKNGFSQDVYFVSSNTSDYMQGSLLHPDLKGEFAAIQLNYMSSILDVKGELFRKINIASRGKSRD